MSRPDEFLDERIRATLLRTPVGDADAQHALPLIRAGARSRRNRHRAVAGAVGASLAVGLVAVSIARSDRSETVVTDTPPTSSAPGAAAYGFPALTPLVDGPLPDVPGVELAVDHGNVLAVSSSPGSLSLSLIGPTGVGGGLSGDPRSMPALVTGGIGASSSDPDPRGYLIGVTRAEVARVDWVRESGIVSVETIAHDALPQLRVFLIADTERTLIIDGPIDAAPLLRAYDDSGMLLTDTKRIHAEEDELVADPGFRGVAD